MHMTGHFSKVLIDDLHLFGVARGAKLAGHQCLVELLLTAHLDATSVVVGTLSTTSREALLQHGIVNNANFSDLIHLKSNRNAGVGKCMHKVHGAVHRIDYPSGIIGQLVDTRSSATLFLANKPAIEAIAFIGFFHCKFLFHHTCDPESAGECHS